MADEPVSVEEHEARLSEISEAKRALDEKYAALEAEEEQLLRELYVRGQEQVRIQSLEVEAVKRFTDRQELVFPEDETELHLIVGGNATGRVDFGHARA